MKVFLLLTILAATVNGKPYDEDVGIIGGKDAPESGIPYMASVRNDSGFHIAGGALIAPRWVITSAIDPYFVQINRTTVVVGSNYLLKGGTSYKVDKYIRHEKINLTSYNIGLLHVDRDIELNERVQIIKLVDQEIPSKFNVQLSGWGITSKNMSSDLSDHLQVINETLLSFPECLNAWSDFDNTQLCAFPKMGTGACIGDGGSPLVYGGELIGIHAFILDYCARGNPNFFANVFYLRDWITKHIN